MIYDFALEPELVATWHDPRVAYPVLCQVGLGHRRVACVFPATAWTKLVMSAFQTSVPHEETAQWQSARKKIEILLRHLQDTGTRRNGRLIDGETWLNAATREHGQFPFGGIIVRSSGVVNAHVVAVDRLGEQDFPAWTPPAAPVVRQPKELATALAPLLRCAAQVRFVDPYFDADDASFFEPMKAYLLAAQQRRSVGDFQVQIHFAVRPEEVEQASRIQGRQMTESDVAKHKLAACESRLGPLLQTGVIVRALAWGKGVAGVKMHNRYVLTEVGGIAVQTGLDQNARGMRQTDDLTVLSKEQHEARWSEFSAEGVVHRLIANHRFASTPSGSR
ncbi:MAG: hypothetical protein EOO71_01375 [Myxococcaceae bacterium]|nr:MAG: hypothetical protein EOO71_01375 [Myxococcaceae bacterium]